MSVIYVVVTLCMISGVLAFSSSPRFASRRMNLESTEHVRLDTRLKVETKPPDKGVVII
jgi:hypothetical protein